MALLLDRWSAGQSPGLVAPDLAAEVARIEAEQVHPLPTGSFDIAAYRSWLVEYAALIEKGRRPHALQVAERRFATAVGPVPARVYTPRAERSVIVFVHGGGWVIGSVDSHDRICRWLAHASGSRVVSVDYGLAPEHPYPTAVLQTAGVLSAILDENQGEERSVFIAGDSAGANIAAMAVLACDADRRKRIAGFVSIYGAYSPHLNLSSHKLYGDGRFGLSEAQMRWFWNLYAPHVPPDQRDQLSPLGADLESFPPTLCIGAECDLLLDDTIAFYSSLTRAGADVSLSLWPGINHGALHFVEIVDSVTAAGGAIIRYIEERRRTSGEALPPTPVGLARMLQTQPPAPLASTVMADPDATLRQFAGGPFAPIDNAFLTSRLRLHGSVAHRLATEIVGGVHPPGALLPREEDASASYGVSRSAYREAIRTLAAKGLVTATPKVGTKVAAQSAWRLLDPDVIAWHFEAGCTATFVRSLFEMRKIVEPSAAALTATRRDEEALSRLADALARLARVTPDDRDWQGAILDFHHVILTASENEFLVAMWPTVQVTMQWSLNLQASHPDHRPVGEPVAEHAKVFEHIASQNAEGALREMAFLIDAALADTITVVARARPQPSARAASA
jgi:acetyl esterase/lipase/DNA-binding FadR family transcriptional regulator